MYTSRDLMWRRIKKFCKIFETKQRPQCTRGGAGGLGFGMWRWHLVARCCCSRCHEQNLRHASVGPCLPAGCGGRWAKRLALLQVPLIAITVNTTAGSGLLRFLWDWRPEPGGKKKASRPGTSFHAHKVFRPQRYQTPNVGLPIIHK
jgi:hypothetical protein